MKKIVFATGNYNKLKEIRSAVGSFEIIGLLDIKIIEELPETGNTLKENALQKAIYINEKTGMDCFSDDTGLEIEALGGLPGVYSARYAGRECDAEKNMLKVLNELKGFENRKATFKTVIALILNEKHYFFEGEVLGLIRKDKKGDEGFGYDPIFQPIGYKESFAEMSIIKKNKISHRGLAVKKLINFFSQL